jgi:MSHA pilin protein MshC
MRAFVFRPFVKRRFLRYVRPAAGFTMIELIVVIVLTGILGALAASRFFDSTAFETREYSDHARGIIRYAQKLAIAQNRPIYVSATANRFAVCTAAACGAGTLVNAPGGSNSGSSVTKAQCTLGGNYVSAWMCEGKPASVALATSRATEAGGANSYFYFDAMGRPFNAADVAPPGGYVSTFAQALVLTFTGSGASHVVTVEPETGYVH